jgi:integrase/recombinase XerD
MLRKMLLHARSSSTAERDRVIILLSVKAGLRASEIAKLDWSMVLDPQGRVGHLITVCDAIAKMGSGRRIPMHPILRRALLVLCRSGNAVGPVICSVRGGCMRPNSIVNWFVTLFAALGFEGCSSHSGRRTFITLAARNLHRAGCSLRDVQLLAGHRSIDLTQGYIDGYLKGQRRLVAML